jgi:hypothetical protein
MRMGTGHPLRGGKDNQFNVTLQFNPVHLLLFLYVNLLSRFTQLAPIILGYPIFYVKIVVPQTKQH